MAGSITSANTIFSIGITDLFDSAQVLQGFAADDIFDVDDIECAEVRMGVDGHLSAGFVFNPIKQSISFMADSKSIELFETWIASEKAARDKYFAFATVEFPSLSKMYSLSGGTLSAFSTMPSAKKVLETRKFTITWESVDAVPV